MDIPAELERHEELDVRYATADNFLGTAVYTSPRASAATPPLHAPAVRVHKLAEQGYGLLIHDAYRPCATDESSGTLLEAVSHLHERLWFAA